MTPYLLGYLTLFFLEAATVFLNDWFDFDSDRRNRNAGLFTGGSVHGAWLWHRLRRFTHKEMPQRINGSIVLALTFILWFCVPPLIVLVRAGAR